ncbi:MAG: diguanylate cyclase [Candidatus Wallbacteria bacterium]|nr:diguanylate cyclase [Candidatus Wallbacteria bacterium]
MPSRKLKIKREIKEVHLRLFRSCLKKYGLTMSEKAVKSSLILEDACGKSFYFIYDDKHYDLDFLELAVEFLFDKCDGLTGLLKREPFLEEFTVMLHSMAEDEYHTLMLLDLDFFKKINDSYGHLAGDKVLSGFAQLLERETSGKCICGRFGGEEFMVFLVHREKREAWSLLERLREKALGLDYGIGTSVNFSAGLITRCGSNSPEDEFNFLLEKSDISLYQAKKMGRGRSVSFDEVLDCGGAILYRLPNHEAIISFGRKHGLVMGEKFFVIDRRMNGRELIPGTNGDFLPRRVKGEIFVPHDPTVLQNETSLVNILYELKDWPVSEGDVLEKAEGSTVEIQGEIVSYRSLVKYDLDWLNQEVRKPEFRKNTLILLLIEDAGICINKFGYDVYQRQISALRDFWGNQFGGSSLILKLGELCFFGPVGENQLALFEKKVALIQSERIVGIIFSEPSHDFYEEAKKILPYLSKHKLYRWDDNLFVEIGLETLRKDPEKGLIFLKNAGNLPLIDKGKLNVNLFAAYKLTRDWKMALETFYKIPDSELNHILWGMAGEIYFFAGDPERAENCYQTSLKLKPDYENSLNNLAQLYITSFFNDRVRLELALQLVNSALISKPDQPNFLDTLRQLNLLLENKKCTD